MIGARTSSLSALVLLSSLAACVSDEAVVRGADVPLGFFDLQVQNDSIGLGDNTDRGYTNGVEIAYTLASSQTPAGLEAFAQNLPLFPEGASGTAVQFVFGQEMYTPDDLSAEQLLSGDRPYAGWLYGGMRAKSLTLDESDSRHDRLDVWALDIGVVGPSSRADQYQREFHKLIGSADPRGWRHQIRDEVGAILRYERHRRGGATELWEGVDGDITTAFEAQVGNIDTRVTLGTSVRIGWNLPRDFGTGLEAAASPGDAAAARARESGHVFFVLGVDGHAVARNIFLDGNTVKDSHSVDKLWFVAELRAGFEIELTRRIRLSYLHHFRTPEFETGTSNARRQDFAALWLRIGI